MVTVVCDPPLSPAARRIATAFDFIQSIELRDDQTVLGRSRWHIAGDGSTGVAQLLDLSIALPHRRKHHGTRLLEATLDQIRRYFQTRNQKPRRVWMNVQQKAHIGGRAFLTHLGFHHTSTINSLLKDEDALVYVLSMD